MRKKKGISAAHAVGAGQPTEGNSTLPDLSNQTDSPESGTEENIPKNCFVLRLPLDESPFQRNRLDKVFQVANTIVNNLISERKGALVQLERDARWRKVRAGLKVLNLQIYKLKKIKEDKRTDEQKKSLADLETARTDLNKLERGLREEYGFTMYAFMFKVKKYQKFYSNLVPAQTAQKLAKVVWAKFSAYLSGKADSIQFSRWGDFFSIEGSCNTRGITYEAGYIQYRTNTSRRSKKNHLLHTGSLF